MCSKSKTYDKHMKSCHHVYSVITFSLVITSTRVITSTYDMMATHAFALRIRSDYILRQQMINGHMRASAQHQDWCIGQCMGPCLCQAHNMDLCAKCNHNNGLEPCHLIVFQTSRETYSVGQWSERQVHPLGYEIVCAATAKPTLRRLFRLSPTIVYFLCVPGAQTPKSN